jgi:hypothetical protein
MSLQLEQEVAIQRVNPQRTYPTIFRMSSDGIANAGRILDTFDGERDRYFMRHLILSPSTSKSIHRERYKRKIGPPNYGILLPKMATPIPYVVDNVRVFHNQRGHVLCVDSTKTTGSALDADLTVVHTQYRRSDDFNHTELSLGHFSLKSDALNAARVLEKFVAVKDGVPFTFDAAQVELL